MIKGKENLFCVTGQTEEQWGNFVGASLYLCSELTYRERQYVWGFLTSYLFVQLFTLGHV